MATVTDLFERAASTGLGPDWAEDSGDFSIASSTARQTTAGGSLRKLRWTGAALGGNNHDAEVDGSSSSTGSERGFGAFVRGASTAAVTYYSWIGYGGDAFYLEEVTTGTPSTLATGPVCNTSTVYNARIGASSNTMTGYRDDVFGASASDTSLSAASAFGIAMYANLNTANDYADNFLCNDNISAGGGIWGRLMAFELNRRVTA